jgi:hypothetical protein
MDIQENRRARLRTWFSNKSLPTKEKSYLSQLLSGKASFGEKAARRLETTYGMPERYLDEPAAERPGNLTLLEFAPPREAAKPADSTPPQTPERAKRIAGIVKNLEKLGDECLAVADANIAGLVGLEEMHRVSVRHLKNRPREEDGSS